ncbi:MAG: S8 family serine peptidase [Candidatus Sumerlaeota bacterium]|nr:S8 family serine peptidase [Candidatus Sumerlaeota bacterium]
MRLLCRLLVPAAIFFCLLPVAHAQLKNAQPVQGTYRMVPSDEEIAEPIVRPSHDALQGSVYDITPKADKALKFEDIYNRFMAGDATVDVIVTLFQPIELRTTNFESASSKGMLRNRCVALENDVLGSYKRADINLKLRYYNFAGFSATVTLSGFDELLRDPRVAHINPVETVQAHTSFGLAKIDAAGFYRHYYTGKFFDPIIDINANPNHEIYSKQVAIAICDTGIDARNPDLGGGYVPNVCTEYITAPIGSGVKVVQHNVYVGGGVYPPTNPHGTMCAGIAAGWWPGEYYYPINTGLITNYISSFEASTASLASGGYSFFNDYDNFVSPPYTLADPRRNRNHWSCPLPPAHPAPREPHWLTTAGTAEMNWYSGGVAHEATIYDFQVLNPAGAGAFDVLLRAWDDAVTLQFSDPFNPIMVISNSLGGGQYFASCDNALPPFVAAIAACEGANITVFASSGNNGFTDSMAAPACVTGVVSVGGINNTDDDPAANFGPINQVSSYSNSVSFLGCLAPSGRTCTTYLATPCDKWCTPISGPRSYRAVYSKMYDFYTRIMNGTSAACPYTAGTAVVCQAAFRRMYGYFAPASLIRAAITQTGTPILDRRNGVVKNRISLAEAVDFTLHNQAPYVSPVMDQGTDGFERFGLTDYGAGVAYAMGYYYKSYQEYKERRLVHGNEREMGLPLPDTVAVPFGMPPEPNDNLRWINTDDSNNPQFNAYRARLSYKFDARYKAGPAPLTTVIGNLSQNLITGAALYTSWDVYFGDGTSQSLAGGPPFFFVPTDIEHTYTKAGYYDVTLVLHGVDPRDGGPDMTLERSSLITVYAPNAPVEFPTSQTMVQPIAPTLPMSPYYVIKNTGGRRFQFCGELLTGHGIPLLKNYSILDKRSAAAVEAAGQSLDFISLAHFPLFTPHRVKVNKAGEFQGAYLNDIAPLQDRLRREGSFVMGIPIFSDFYHWNFGMYTEPRDKTVLGYHAITVIGYDPNLEQPVGDQRYTGAFLCKNSWGNSWGTPVANMQDQSSASRGYVWLWQGFVQKYAIEAWAMTDSRTEPIVLTGTTTTDTKRFYSISKEFDLTYTYSGPEGVYWPELYFTVGDYGRELTILNGGPADSVKLTRRRCVREVVGFYRIKSDGNFANFYTEAPIEFLQADFDYDPAIGGTDPTSRFKPTTLKSVVASNAYIRNLYSPEMGNVQMFDTHNYTWPEIARDLANNPAPTGGDFDKLRNDTIAVSIVETNDNTPKAGSVNYPAAPTHKLNVDINGLKLKTLIAPLADVSLTLASKKIENGADFPFLTYGASDSKLTSAIIEANVITSIKIDGGDLSPTSITAHRIGTLSARRQTLSSYYEPLALPRIKFLSSYGGNIQPQAIVAVQGGIDTIESIGGVINVGLLSSHENIKKISSRIMTVREDRGLGPYKVIHGGIIGNLDNPSSMVVISGDLRDYLPSERPDNPSNDMPMARAQFDPLLSNITLVQADLAVGAWFYCGITFDKHPSFVGYLKGIATRSLSQIPIIAEPNRPSILGQSWSRIKVNLRSSGGDIVFIESNYSGG